MYQEMKEDTFVGKRKAIPALACMQAFQRRETSGERSEPRGEWGEGEKEQSL